MGSGGSRLPFFFFFFFLQGIYSISLVIHINAGVILRIPTREWNPTLVLCDPRAEALGIEALVVNPR